MTADIREARFYVIDEADGDAPGDAQSFAFEAAFEKANALAENGSRVKVFYTGEASQTEITRFMSAGIPAEPRGYGE